MRAGSSSLLRSRLSGCHATLPLLSGERCVTSRKTAAKETMDHPKRFDRFVLVGGEFFFMQQLLQREVNKTSLYWYKGIGRFTRLVEQYGEDIRSCPEKMILFQEMTKINNNKV